MKDGYRFMNELFRIINGALRLDTEKVRNYTAYLADKLEEDGETASAILLRKMLNETDRQLHPANSNFQKRPPVDTESRLPLIEIIDLKNLREPPLFLSQEQWDVVNEFLSVAKSYAQLDVNEIGGSLSLLIYGPPGTGKSRLARHIARELALPLYVARLDGLISSFLGSTSKNIRTLFDFAAANPCILFLDEFDAIAKLRSDHQELGELKRVVNSFIQNLDTIGQQSIVLAATNHDNLLDSAIWRRFSYRLELDIPTKGVRKDMWKVFLHGLKYSDKEENLLVDLSEGFSGSDIKEAALRLLRKKLTNNKKPSLRDAFQIMQNIAIGNGEEKRFVSSFKDKEFSEIANNLRQRNEKIYSFDSLAQLLGISKATIHRAVSQEA